VRQICKDTFVEDPDLASLDQPAPHHWTKLKLHYTVYQLTRLGWTQEQHSMFPSETLHLLSRLTQVYDILFTSHRTNQNLEFSLLGRGEKGVWVEIRKRHSSIRW